VTWVGHVARRGYERCIQGFSGGNVRERDHLGDLGADKRIILKLALTKWDRDRCQQL